MNEPENNLIVIKHTFPPVTFQEELKARGQEMCACHALADRVEFRFLVQPVLFWGTERTPRVGTQGFLPHSPPEHRRDRKFSHSSPYGPNEMSLDPLNHPQLDPLYPTVSCAKPCKRGHTLSQMCLLGLPGGAPLEFRNVLSKGWRRKQWGKREMSSEKCPLRAQNGKGRRGTSE